MFRKLCGDTTLKNVVLVTNMWGDVTPETGKAREKELSSRFFKPVLDEGAQIVPHHNTTQSAHDIIRKIMTNHPEALRIQQELVDENKDITDTEAGAAVNQELSELIDRHKAELEGLREEMAEALREKDEVTRREIAEQAKKLQDLVEKTEKDKKEMSLGYAEERERMEAKFAKMMEEARKERERAEAARARVEREAEARAEAARVRMMEEVRKEREYAEAARLRMERELKERERTEAARVRLVEEAKKTREWAETEVRKERERAEADRVRREEEERRKREEKFIAIPIHRWPWENPFLEGLKSCVYCYSLLTFLLITQSYDQPIQRILEAVSKICCAAIAR